MHATGSPLGWENSSSNRRQPGSFCRARSARLEGDFFVCQSAPYRQIKPQVRPIPSRRSTSASRRSRSSIRLGCRAEADRGSGTSSIPSARRMRRTSWRVFWADRQSLGVPGTASIRACPPGAVQRTCRCLPPGAMTGSRMPALASSARAASRQGFRMTGLNGTPPRASAAAAGHGQTRATRTTGQTRTHLWCVSVSVRLMSAGQISGLCPALSVSGYEIKHLDHRSLRTRRKSLPSTTLTPIRPRSCASLTARRKALLRASCLFPSVSPSAAYEL